MVLTSNQAATGLVDNEIHDVGGGGFFWCLRSRMN